MWHGTDVLRVSLVASAGGQAASGITGPAVTASTVALLLAIVGVGILLSTGQREPIRTAVARARAYLAQAQWHDFARRSGLYSPIEPGTDVAYLCAELRRWHHRAGLAWLAYRLSRTQDAPPATLVYLCRLRTEAHARLLIAASTLDPATWTQVDDLILGRRRARCDVPTTRQTRPSVY